MLAKSKCFKDSKLFPMKHSFFAFFLAIILFSCEEGFETDVNRTQEFNLVLQTGNETSSVAWSETLDLSKDNVFETYKDRLVRYRLEKITLTIRSLDPAENATLEGQIAFSDGAGATQKAIAGLVNFQMNQLDTEQEITLDQGGIEEFLTLLKNTDKANIHLNGDLSQVPVRSELTLKFYFVIVAKVI